MTWAPECEVNWVGLSLASLLAALPLALALSWVTLTLYRRAVGRAMRVPASVLATEQTRHAAKEPQATPPSPLSLVSFAPPTQPLAPVPRQGASVDAMRRVSGVYVVAGVLHALIVAALLIVAGGIEFLPVRFLTLWFVYTWPVVPVFALTAAGRRRSKIAVIVGYFVALVAFDAAITVAGVSDGAGRLAAYWALEMLPPTLLLWLLGNRTMRCVGLIALLVSTALTTTGFASFQGLGCLALTTRSALLLDWFLALQIAVVVMAIVLLWRTLRVWTARVAASGASDQMVTVDSWWLLITAIEMLLMTPALGLATPLLLVAFVAYKSVTIVGLCWTRSKVVAGPVPQLLMLRVFGHARRTERLLDEIGARWRYAGPINLVAGTDIATSFLDPDELLQFVGGRLSDAYISDGATLEARIARLENRRSTDGRFGLHEYFCRDHMWRQTVEQLAARSDAVVIDLRSFSAANRGCEFELGVLLNTVDLAKVTMIVDTTTDRRHLERTLHDMWQRVGGGGINAAAPAPAVVLMHAEGHGAVLAENLLDRLFRVVAAIADR